MIVKRKRSVSSGKPSKARVKDVALAAGVSVATVSRSFNLPQTVSEPVRKVVLDHAARLGYSPNPSAKALRLQRTHIAGAVFPSTEYGVYAQMLAGFQQHMSEAGYLTVLLTVGFDNTQLYEPVRKLVERGAEALMIVGRIDDERLSQFLLEHRIPVVCTYSDLPENRFVSVGIDNYAAMSKIMSHLIHLGHREFALFSGPTQGNDRQQARRQAFIDMLHKCGIQKPPRIYEDPQGYSLDYGVSAFHEMRRKHPDVTALVCCSDLYGMTAISEARRLGIDVPGQLSVTGFDNQSLVALVDPPLTTISVPASQMGHLAAQMLLNTRDAASPNQHLQLDAPLIVRGSTGVAPRSNTRG